MLLLLLLLLLSIQILTKDALLADDCVLDGQDVGQPKNTFIMLTTIIIRGSLLGCPGESIGDCP
jgi:hypothetical protein